MRRLIADPEFYEKSERHGKENRLTNDELVRLEMKCLAATGQLDNLHDFVTERKEDLLSLYDEIEKKKAAGERFEESEATRLFTQLMRVIALAHQHGVIHRQIHCAEKDIVDENKLEQTIYLTPAGSVRVFGWEEAFAASQAQIEQGQVVSKEMVNPSGYSSREL